MFVHYVLEAPKTKTNSLCVQTHLAIKLFLILTSPFSHSLLGELILWEKKQNWHETWILSDECEVHYLLNHSPIHLL